MLSTALAAAGILCVNIIGATAFVADKRAAVAARRRVPERVLLTLAALGAAPMMIWLSRRIRHKTRKQPFRALLLAILGAQLLALLVVVLNGLGVARLF